MVKVECDGCKAPYQIDEKRIPPTGLKMRCPKCGTNLLVTKPAEGGTGEAASLPPRPPTLPSRPSDAGGDADLPMARAGAAASFKAAAPPRPPPPRPGAKAAPPPP